MFEFFATTYGTQLLGLILCAIFGTLGYVVKQIAKTYLDNETKLSIAANVVRFVEQVWTEIHGTEKLQKALETAESLLKKKGIPFDADEMTVLIEAAVQELNNEVILTPIEAPETASAVRRSPYQEDDHQESGLLE